MASGNVHIAFFVKTNVIACKCPCPCYNPRPATSPICDYCKNYSHRSDGRPKKKWWQL